MTRTASDVVHTCNAHEPLELAIAPGGGYAVLRTGGAMHLFHRASGRRLELAAPAQLACLADELLTLTRAGETWELRRLRGDGKLLGEPLVLALARPPSIAVAPSAVPVALIRGPAGLELRGGATELAISDVATADDAFPLGPRTRIERRDSRLWLHRPGGDLAIDLPLDLVSRSTIVAAAHVLGGSAIAIDLEARGARQLVTVDARRGALIARLVLEAIDDASLVPGRDQLVVRRGDEITVIHLRTLRVACVHAVPANATVAFDPLGRWAAIATSPDSIEIVPGDDLLCPRPASETGELPAEVELEPLPALDEAVAANDDVAAEPAPAPAPAPPPPAPEPPAPPAPADDDEADRRAALAHAALPALGDGVAAPLDDAARRELASAWSRLIQASCRRALAEAWDSGRITGEPGAFPFDVETAAVLDDVRGRAAERVVEAIEREIEASRGFAAWSRAGAPHVDLARAFGLSPIAITILLTAAAPQLWPDLARVYAVIANDQVRPFCDEHLLATLLGAGAAPGAIAAELDEHAPLVRHGLVGFGAGARPFRGVVVPRAIVRRLLGEPSLDDDRVTARDAAVGLDAVIAPLAALEDLVAALGRTAAAPPRIVLRGRRASGRRTLAAALAAQAGRRLGVIDVEGVPASDLAGAIAAGLRAAALRGWLPCLAGLEPGTIDAAHAAAVQLTLARHPGPLVVCLDGDAVAPLAPGHLDVALPPLDHRTRTEAWCAAMARHGLADDGVASLAARFSVGPGTIETVVAQVASSGTGDACHRLEQAVRAERAVALRGVAQRVARLASWDGVILPPDTLDSVRSFVARVRHRRRVLEDWGMEDVASTARGLTALFQGAPGTGKTLVAGAIARELGYDLYRIDLSQVMSKWLGETEKNLAKLFAAAEQGECVLLFDEADSLFTRRTEVRSSNDRYANLEVNYLLQRLDTFEGIAILTTNFGSAIDPAFRRRMSVRVTFPFPDEETRRDLWRAHLPPRLPVEGDLALDELARRFQLSGGYIRNAALRAAHLAADEARTVTADLLVRAVRLELQEMGKLGEGGVVE